MKSLSIILIGIVTCLAAISNGQSYIRLSRSDQSSGLIQKLRPVQKQKDGVTENTELIHQIKSIEAPVQRGPLKTFPPQGYRYGDYYTDDFIKLPNLPLKIRLEIS